MLVGLEGQVQHFASFVTLLVDELVANTQQTREAALNDLVKLCAVIAFGRLITEGPAKSQQALQTSKYGTRLVDVEQVHRVVDEARPS